MGDRSILASKLEKMIERIVASSLKEFLCFDKGKEHVNIEDDENKGESEKEELGDETWQDEVFFAKRVTNKKNESEAVL
ncbi:hypothetical protein JCGZ_26642 [Jatropha curcas]|uniref:Uncharacterized protein n=1 Tax=Jatropha curcas TaxID=180498 RepID=A0A067JK53_JATCU|nr:hypothetical protein JCGZ_26642 [Jatropha curcas]